MSLINILFFVCLCKQQKKNDERKAKMKPITVSHYYFNQKIYTLRKFLSCIETNQSRLEMKSFLYSILCLFGKDRSNFRRSFLFWLNRIIALITISDGINCVSCIGWNNAGCNDPYDPDTSRDIPVPGNTYCLVSEEKIVKEHQFLMKIIGYLESRLSKLYRTNGRWSIVHFR